MAMLRYGHAALVTPIVDPFKWVEKKVPASRVKVARNVVAKYDPAKWLLSHATIIASVDTVFADKKNKKSNYLIIPEYSQFVNNNGDCWERELVKATYKTFLGADNYLEHMQIPELSKGKVIDVALREVPIGKSSEGKDLTTLYVDILIATNKDHTDLIDKIKNGEYNATSMGCLIAYSQCSQCGKIAEDEAKLCKHVKYFKKNKFVDKNGITRIVAELCGRAEDSASCKFIDASWVRKPAFPGAVVRNLVEPSEDIAEKIRKVVMIPSFQPQPGMLLKAASEAAAALVNEIQAQEEGKAPPPKAEPPKEEAAPSKDDTDFPEAPSGAPLSLDTPPAEGAAPEPAAETPPGADLPIPGGEAGASAAPPAPSPQIQEPAEDATVKEVEEMMTKQILNKIRRKLMEGEVSQKTQENEKPIESESTNSGLIKDAAMKSKLIKLAKDSGNERLLNGIIILSNIKDWKSFKKYGYTKEDVVGLLHFVDKNVSNEPVGSDAVMALSKIKTANSKPKEFFTEMIIETGRRFSTKEARKLLKWAKIMSKL